METSFAVVLRLTHLLGTWRDLSERWSSFEEPIIFLLSLSLLPLWGQ